jgi:hypothetical protein
MSALVGGTVGEAVSGRATRTISAPGSARPSARSAPSGLARAAPMLAVTGNPQVSTLFAAQTLIDVWIIGTSVLVALPEKVARR